MLLKNLILSCSCCDVCGKEKTTEMMCSMYIYTDELNDITITKESCWNICNECLNLIQPRVG